MTNSDWIEVQEGAYAHKTARINCEEILLGRGTRVAANAVIEARSVRIGRDSYIGEYAVIGGGSAFADTSYLVAGDFFFMTMYSHANTGWGIEAGDEVGFGMMTRVFTHGAFLSEWDGFPAQFAAVKIGSRVTLMHASVLPGVTIGNDVFVAAETLINRDVPSDCIFGGIPGRILRQPARRLLSPAERVKLLETLAGEIAIRTRQVCTFDPNTASLSVAGASFYLDDRRIDGEVNEFSLSAKDQLRRHGIRFRYDATGAQFVPWQAD